LATVDASRFEESNIIEVECIPLAKVLGCFEHIKAVKIDVEGSELMVLRGMENILAKVDFLIVEISDSSVISFLKSRGFKMLPLGFTTYVLAVKKKKTFNLRY